MDKSKVEFPQDIQQGKMTMPKYPTPTFQLQYVQEDEFSLVDLWNILVKHRMMIMALPILTTVAAVLYAFLATPSPFYKSSTVLLPPNVQDVRSLFMVQSGISDSKKAVYATFKSFLKSFRLASEFLNEPGIAELLTIKKPIAPGDVRMFLSMTSEKENIDFFIFSITGKDPVVATQLANQYVTWIDRKTVESFLAENRQTIDSRIRDLEAAISNKLKLAQQQRENLVIELTESLEIASALKLTEPVVIGFAIPSFPLPGFYQGTKALTSQLKALKTRADDRPFIPELPALGNELNSLKSTPLPAAETLHAVIVDQPADNAIRQPTRQKLIIVIGFIVGLMLGVFGALFSNFISNVRKSENDRLDSTYAT